MIDTHCHVLPGIDDGAKSAEESIAMLKMAQQDGVNALIATPHIHVGRFNNNIDSIKESINTLLAHPDYKNIGLPVKFAAEIRLCPELLYWIDEGKVPWLSNDNGEKRLLLEFSSVNYPQGAVGMCQYLKDRGITPVIAHPERYRYWQRNPLDINNFVRLGCEFQVTAGSLLGRFREGAQKLAEALLKQNKVSWIASDAHNLASRPIRLSESFAATASMVGTKKAETLFIEKPGEVFTACPGTILTENVVRSTTQQAVTSDI